MRNRQLIFALALTLLLHPVMPSQAQAPKGRHSPQPTRRNAIAPIRSFPFPGIYSLYAMSPDGTMVAIALQDTFDPSKVATRVWRVKDGHLLRSFSSDGQVGDIAFSPDSKRLAILNATSETRQSPPGRFKRVSLWSLRSGKRLFQLSHLYEGQSLAFSPNDQTLAFSYIMESTTPQGIIDNQVIRLVSAQTGRSLKVLSTSLPGVTQISFSSESRYLSAISEGGEAGIVSLALWNHRGKLLAYTDNAAFFVGYLFFLNNSQALIDVDTVMHYHQGHLAVTDIRAWDHHNYFALGPVGRHQVLCYDEPHGAIICWDMASSRQRRICRLKDGKSLECSLSTKSNGKLVAGVKNNRLFIWRLPSLRSRMRSHK